MQHRGHSFLARWLHKARGTQQEDTGTTAATMPSNLPSLESNPVYAQFSAHHLVIGTGVAIFHVASSRVVLCYHSRDRYWFLPKGRRDAGESTERAAQREGFEEVYDYAPTLQC